MASKKHQRLQRGGKDKHHFYWPKKLYRKMNQILTIPYSVHHDYHGFFMSNCKFPTSRHCRDGSYCNFEGMCCYNQTNVPYGQRVI